MRHLDVEGYKKFKHFIALPILQIPKKTKCSLIKFFVPHEHAPSSYSFKGQIELELFKGQKAEKKC